MAGNAFTVSYRIEGAGSGTPAANLNGVNLPFSRVEQVYCIGAAAALIEPN
jgi:hypothetical protein